MSKESPIIENMRSRHFLALLPLTLPFTFLVPYALFVEKFRVLLWVWRSPYLPFWISFVLIVASSLLCAIFLFRLLPGALTLYAFTLFLTIAQPSYLAMLEHRHFLLVLIFLLLCFQTYIFEYLRSVLAEPYYSARRSWWEVYPKAIPHLRASLYSDRGGEKFHEARLSNFGKTGCFVFIEDGTIPFVPRYVEIKSGEKILLERPVVLAAQTKDSFGMGLRFVAHGDSADWTKDLEDYLGYLRRVGYVDAY